LATDIFFSQILTLTRVIYFCIGYLILANIEILADINNGYRYFIFAYNDIGYRYFILAWAPVGSQISEHIREPY